MNLFCMSCHVLVVYRIFPKIYCYDILYFRMAFSINYFQISSYYRFLSRRPVCLKTFSPKMSTVKRTIIHTDKAPSAIGPYNQAVLADKTLYISGSLGLIPDKMELVEGGVKSETHQSLKNIGEILKVAGATYNNVVKTTILLADINDFPVVNEVYKEYFTNNFPARACYQVAALPKAARVEIEAVAVLGEIQDA